MILETILFNTINSYDAYNVASILLFVSNISMVVFALSTIPFALKDRRTGINYTAAIITSILVSLFLEQVFCRPRPTGILRVPEESSYSFPSTHSAASFAWADFASDAAKKYRILFFAFAILVGISRIYVGVHYPTDVIVGGLLGWAIAKALKR
ncbi:MAG: phosphatase PAP2 family protein [Candidatus Aenigmatarchaeota archaeon]